MKPVNRSKEYMTPTWVGITPALLDVVRTTDDPKALAIAKEELMKMASVADRYNKLITRSKRNKRKGH